MVALLDWFLQTGKGDKQISPPVFATPSYSSAPSSSASKTSSPPPPPTSPPSSPSPTPSSLPPSSSSASPASSSLLQNVKATDYPTPQKYLDDPDKIPSYYVFSSNMVTNEDLQPGMLNQLEVDKRLTLPTRTHIKFLITATDVIHSFTIPSLGFKADAVPGRMVKVNTFIQREGVFYGQCSELCGTLHGYMPIVIEAVSPEAYAAHAKKFYKD